MEDRHALRDVCRDLVAGLDAYLGELSSNQTYMREVDVLRDYREIETGSFREAMQELSDICIKPSTILRALIEQRAHIGQQLSQHLMAQANLLSLYEVIDRDHRLLCHINQRCPPS